MPKNQYSADTVSPLLSIINNQIILLMSRGNIQHNRYLKSSSILLFQTYFKILYRGYIYCTWVIYLGEIIIKRGIANWPHFSSSEPMSVPESDATLKM